VLLAFVVLDLVSSVLRQEIGYEEHLRNDLGLFCAECDVKPQLNQSATNHARQISGSGV